MSTLHSTIQFGVNQNAPYSTPQQTAPPVDAKLDAEDIWLTSNLRYLGYADEVGVALSHVEKMRTCLAKGLGKVLRNPAKGEQLAYKLYSVPGIGKEKSIPALGYMVAYVYCALNMISRAFQGWHKARDGGNNRLESGLKTAGDLVGLGVFHYLATMRLAPKFLDFMGHGFQRLAMNQQGQHTIKELLRNNKPIHYKSGMFEGSWIAQGLKKLGIKSNRLSKAYPLLQLGLAVGLIPLISHPFDKGVQTLLDYTWRPLIGMNKFQRADNALGFRSVPNPRYWNRNYQPPQDSSHLHGTLHRRSERFHMLFAQNKMPASI